LRFSNSLKFTKLDFFVIKECIPSFVLSFGLIFLVWFGLVILQDAFEFYFKEKAQLEEILKFILYSIPEIFTIAVPIGLFIGCFLSFLKLSNNSEIVAMQASGVSLYRILYPVAVWGLSLSLLVLVINEIAFPNSRAKAREIKNSIRYKFQYKADSLKTNNPEKNIKNLILFQYDPKKGKGHLKKIIFATKYLVDKNQFQNLTYLKFADNLNNGTLYNAKKAYFGSKNQELILENIIQYPVLLNNSNKNNLGSLYEKNNPESTYFSSELNKIDQKESKKRVVLKVEPELKEICSSLYYLKYKGLFSLIRIFYLHKKLGILSTYLSRTQEKFIQRYFFVFASFLVSLIGGAEGVIPKRQPIYKSYLRIGFGILVYYIFFNFLNAFIYYDKFNFFFSFFCFNFLSLYLSYYLINKKNNLSS